MQVKIQKRLIQKLKIHRVEILREVKGIRGIAGEVVTEQLELQEKMIDEIVMKHANPIHACLALEEVHRRMVVVCRRVMKLRGIAKAHKIILRKARVRFAAQLVEVRRFRKKLIKQRMLDEKAVVVAHRVGAVAWIKKRVVEVKARILKCN